MVWSVAVTGERAQEARRRAAAYALLSRLILEKPTRGFLREIHAGLCVARPDRAEPLTTEVLDLAAAIDAACAGVPPEIDLCVEHTRLWCGVSKGHGPPPPYESVVREQRLPGDASVAVSARYAAAQLEPSAEAGPPDHLATELRFMALCALREAQAWKAGRDAEAAEWAARQREFLEQHVLEWAPAHCDAVAAMARTDYHRAVALLVAAACRLDEVQTGDALEAA